MTDDSISSLTAQDMLAWVEVHLGDLGRRDSAEGGDGIAGAIKDYFAAAAVGFQSAEGEAREPWALAVRLAAIAAHEAEQNERLGEAIVNVDQQRKGIEEQWERTRNDLRRLVDVMSKGDSALEIFNEALRSVSTTNVIPLRTRLRRRVIRDPKTNLIVAVEDEQIP
jgi:hypothetical protein